MTPDLDPAPVVLEPAEYWELSARVQRVRLIKLDLVQQLRDAQTAVDACLATLAQKYPGVPTTAFTLDDRTHAIQARAEQRNSHGD